MGEQLCWGQQAHLEADIWLAAAAHVSGLVCVWKSVLQGPSPPGLGRGERGEPDGWEKLDKQKCFSLYILANPFYLVPKFTGAFAFLS